VKTAAACLGRLKITLEGKLNIGSLFETALNCKLKNIVAQKTLSICLQSSKSFTIPSIYSSGLILF